jgi:hypothetical protein
VNVDWGRLRAVVFQSDDWGLCAWVPDEQAYRALADSPAWRTPSGRSYGRSTLESADDVAQLTEALLEFRGADGFPPVWQANTVMAAPDYEQLVPPLFPVEELPLVRLPGTPSRWRRPGLWEQVRSAQEAGVWWPELHGLHHLPATAWLTALRRGATDARRAHEHQSPVCETVVASSEYDPSEPKEQRVRSLEMAVQHFQTLFGRRPNSLCPPDYRWDDLLEQEAERHGIGILQGKAEQVGRFPTVRRLWRQIHWPEAPGRHFNMPPRIAFEPRGGKHLDGTLGPAAVHRRVRAAWSRSQPAVISTHRASYAHLDPDWSEAGRGALRDLLRRLMADAALFLTDAEVRSLTERGWSARAIGARGVLVRSYGADHDTARFQAPSGVAGVGLREGSAAATRARVENGSVVVQLDRGECLLEWRR